jgi:hypothetical protein
MTLLSNSMTKTVKRKAIKFVREEELDLDVLPEIVS